MSWPPYEPLPGVTGVAALTGLPLDDATAGRAALAVFHSRQPVEVGPVRSARTSDLDVLAGMNRPILAWSGGNPGVTAWVRAAAAAGALVDLSALRTGACYRRESSRRSPHNLVLNTQCARDRGVSAGPARPLWEFLADGERVVGGTPTPRFSVQMDNVAVEWQYDATTGRYVRWQDGSVHVTAAGVPISVTNVVVVSAVHYPSSVDARSPEAQTVGSGPVVVHTGGVARSGRWIRGAATDPWRFEASDGSVIALAPGTSFVELARA